MTRFGIVLFLAITWAFQCAAATIILVRHAERAGGMAADVPLSESGRQRAEALAHLLADTGVQAIFTSEAVRTQQTAAPLAKQLHLEPKTIPARDVATLVDRLKAFKTNETVLVVGHSNTVPEIARQLGVKTNPIAETEFDRLLIVYTSGDSAPTVLTLRYGP